MYTLLKLLFKHFYLLQIFQVIHAYLGIGMLREEETHNGDRTWTGKERSYDSNQPTSNEITSAGKSDREGLILVGYFSYTQKLNK